MPKINRIFRSLQHMLLSLGLVYLFLFILKRVNQVFLCRVSDEAVLLALFPTFLLAGSLNKDSFVTATSVISFFAIFSFVFKSSIWEKGFKEE